MTYFKKLWQYANNISVIYNFNAAGYVDFYLKLLYIFNMSTITVNEKELKMVVRESVREVLAQELMKLRALALPDISNKEQKEIEKLYSKPTRRIAKSIKVKL